jgi:hypothetical protein
MSGILSAPRRPLVVPLVAGVAVLVGAVLTVVSLFSDYYEDFPVTRRLPGQLWFFLLYAAGVAVAGLLLVAMRRTQATGAAALVVIVTTFAGERVLAVYNVAFPERGAGPGFSLDFAGFVLVIVAAVVALGGVIVAGDLHGPWRLVTPGRAGLAAVAAVAGFVTAVGYGLNPSRVAVEVPGGFGQGTPLIASPRSLWAQLLVVVALTAWPAIAVLARRPIAAGLTLGLLSFVAAEAGYRLLSATTKILGRDPQVDAIEGTWVLLIGGTALVAVLGARLLSPEDATRQIPVPGGAPAA